MEFPNLGDHCEESTCKRLDFLPIKCDSCKKSFCNNHISYNAHKCEQPEGYRNKDFQIPICPLCNEPVACKRDDQPDTVISAHIDRDCKSDPAEDRRRQIYANKCSLKGCKKKELMPFECQRCRMNYCIRHRLETDHQCDQIVKNPGEKKFLNDRRLAFFGQKQQQQQTSRAQTSQQNSSLQSSQMVFNYYSKKKFQFFSIYFFSSLKVKRWRMH
jgi:AN1-type zinc finger protein 2